MASTASVNDVRGVQVRNQQRVTAAGPLLVDRLLRPCMTATADRSRQIDPRQHSWVNVIGGVVGRRAVAILALHALEPWGGRGAAKASRQSVTHRVARKISGVVGLAGLLQGLERLRMWRVGPSLNGALMALGAGRSEERRVGKER